ncbi:MAG: hypothetical protein ACYS47_08610 [Planctomycetota bacterium]|jgi:hypothetical protein
MACVHPRGCIRRAGAIVAAVSLVAGVLFLAPGEARAQAGGKKKIPLTISGDFRLWLPGFDGVMQVGPEGDLGSEVRLDRHLDLEEHPEVFELGLGLGDIRYGKLSASFLWFTAPGNKVLTSDIRFGGTDFNAPETVHTDFSIQIDRVSVAYIQDVRGAYILTYEVGMSFFRWKTKIRNRTPGQEKEASEDANSTLPLTGLHAIFPVGNTMRIQIGFSGVFFNTSSDDVNLVDTYGEVTLNLAKYLIVGMGYRHLHFDGELDLKGGKEGNLEYTMGGIYFTIGLKL